MKIIILFLLVISLVPLSGSAQSEIRAQVHFAFDNYILTAPEKKALDQFVNQYRNSGAQKIIISGHTDSFGTEGYNLSLSIKRTQAVRQYLIKNGIAATQIEFNSLGESSPLLANSNAENRQKNRRVELMYRLPAGPKGMEAEKIVEEICPPRTIEAEKGAQVVATCDCFGDIDVKEVEVRIREINTPAEMIEKDIITVDATGNCLESAGMIFIDVLYHGRPIQAGNDSCLKVRIPVENIDPQMRLYRTKTVEGSTGWTLESQELSEVYIDNQVYYEFNVSGGGGFNCDKPIMAPIAIATAPLFFIERILDGLKNDGLVIKTRKYKLSRTYLTNKSGNRMDIGKKLTRRKVEFRNCFSGPEAEVMITLVKDSQNYVVKRSLSDLRYKRFWRKYVIRSGDLEIMTREEMQQAMNNW